MLKEQKKLQQMLKEKETLLEKQESELKELRKQNKKLVLTHNKTKLMMLAQEDHRDMDTPSSEESSPKSSFSKVSKVEIKQRVIANKLAGLALEDNSHSSKESTLRSVVKIGDESSPPSVPPKRPEIKSPPPLQPRLSQKDSNVKPPVPSRAGVNKKLNKPPAPPAPPVRTSSMKSSLKEVDSGRDSDDFATDPETSLNNISTESLATNRSDEGFHSSHEDFTKTGGHQPPLPPPRNSGAIPDIRQLTNHRAVQKPSDIKYRSKLRSATIPPSPGLGVLKEHQVVTSSGEIGDVTTVTYWTEPYL